MVTAGAALARRCAEIARCYKCEDAILSHFGLKPDEEKRGNAY